MAEGQLVLPVPRVRQAFDPSQWQEQGFTSRSEAEHWSHRACGTACVGMLIGYFRGHYPPLADILREGLESDAYSDRGWIHAGLARLLTTHGVPSQATPLGYPQELVAAIEARIPLIVSVSDEFPCDGRKGGHLVVVTGVVNDPSSWGDRHTSVPAARFAASFTGRAIMPTLSVSGDPRHGPAIPALEAGNATIRAESNGQAGSLR